MRKDLGRRLNPPLRSRDQGAPCRGQPRRVGVVQAIGRYKERDETFYGRYLRPTPQSLYPILKREAHAA